MEPRHRAAINKQYSSLVAQTDLNVMLSSLYEKGVFSEHMLEQYKNRHTSETNHKRQLYLHLCRRGPNAFKHLIDTLWENGQWDLARDLDPEGEFHGRPRNTAERSINNDESSFISISSKKKEKAKSESKMKKVTPPPPVVQTPPSPPLVATPAEPDPSDPPFIVNKCTHPISDEGSAIPMYPVGLDRRQRVMLMYTYMHFEHDIEPTRRGADRDSTNLKLLFHELGFTFASYFNQSQEQTTASLRELASTLEGATCVFVVVSSHGYDRLDSSDNYFRCSDGKLISFYDFIGYFSNQALPKLRGVPKVFIFQSCRGNKDQEYPGAPAHMPPPAREVRDGEGRPPPAHLAPAPAPAPRPTRPAPLTSRLFTDILIAHSTLPGYVSNRNPEKGSWYIQTLCQVFAAHAHRLHVEELLTLVDKEMERNFRRQTSSVDKWGFNSRLYLMPGLQH